MEEWADELSQTQITDDSKLIGERLVGEDRLCRLIVF